MATRPLIVCLLLFATVIHCIGYRREGVWFYSSQHESHVNLAHVDAMQFNTRENVTRRWLSGGESTRCRDDSILRALPVLSRILPLGPGCNNWLPSNGTTIVCEKRLDWVKGQAVGVRWECDSDDLSRATMISNVEIVCEGRTFVTEFDQVIFFIVFKPTRTFS